MVAVSNPPTLYERQIIILLIFILAFSAIFIAYAAITGSFTINNAGYVKAIGVQVYFDQECTNQTDFINWGYIRPGDTKNVTVYIRNNGTTPMVLSHTVQNWNPQSAENYITFSWNGEGKVVNVNEVLPVTLSLSVDANITGIGTFSFELVIIGTETSG